MASITKTIANSLQLNKVGGGELLLAMYPVLLYYQFGAVPFNLLVLIILDLWAINKRNQYHHFKFNEYFFLVFYVLIHEVIWLFVIPNPASSFINSIIQYSVLLLSVPIILPVVNWSKFVGSLNWVVIVSFFGILYHFSIVLRGGIIEQIPLPFLSNGGARLGMESTRPRSFFPEPAVYSAFMLYPLFWALTNRKLVYAIIIVIGILMSTSTNGLVLAFVMLAIFLIKGNLSKIAKFGMLLGGIALIFLLMKTDFFSATTDKLIMETERIDESARLAQGPAIVSTMDPGDFVFGVPYATPYDYAEGEGVLGRFRISNMADAIYMTTFWLMILRFGIVGLILYLTVVLKPLKKCKELYPLIGCFFLMLFTSSISIGGSFVFQMIFIYGFIDYHNIMIGSKNIINR